MSQAMRHGQLLQRLEKAVHSGNITAVVPEDLEVSAHSTLWDSSSPQELKLLKLLPSTNATSITHEYTRVDSYGNRRGSGFFAERSLPPETNFESNRITVPIKLMGEIGPTFLLAALEKTQRALGTTGAENIEAVALRENLLWKKNRNMYFSNTASTRLGVNGTRFKGIAQLIAEGTDGTTGTSEYGTHQIDMEGEKLTMETIRSKAANTLTLFGMFNTLLMSPHVRASFEGSLDAAERLPMPISTSPYLIGQMVAGVQTQGNIVHFETDNVLTPLHSRPQYTTDLIDGAPGTSPTVTATPGAVGGGRTSVWKAADAGDVYWVVTELVDELEGTGTRFPAGAAFTTVAAGQEVVLSITPGTALADSFKVYRGTDADVNDPTDAWFIFEVAGDGTGGAVTAYDLNAFRPNTSWAFGMRLVGPAASILHSGAPNSYDIARSRSAEFLRREDDPRNTVAIAELGPSMGIMNLASVLAEVKRPLMYSACAPEVRNPKQNVVFINVGV